MGDMRARFPRCASTRRELKFSQLALTKPHGYGMLKVASACKCWKVTQTRFSRVHSITRETPLSPAAKTTPAGSGNVKLVGCLRSEDVLQRNARSCREIQSREIQRQFGHALSELFLSTTLII